MWKLGTTLVVLATVAGAANADAAANDTFRVTLRDGSLISGTIDVRNLKVRTPYGMLTIPFQDVLMVEFSEEKNQDKLIAARMPIVGRVEIKELALKNKHLGKVRLARHHIVRIERGTGARGFVGTWRGKAADKPGEGISQRSLELELKVNDRGQLEGTASGDFVEGGEAELENPEIKANWLQFEIEGETGRFRIRLELKDGKLQGEAIPFDPDEDACDITLEPKDGAPRGLSI